MQSRLVRRRAPAGQHDLQYCVKFRSLLYHRAVLPSPFHPLSFASHGHLQANEPEGQQFDKNEGFGDYPSCFHLSSLSRHCIVLPMVRIILPSFTHEAYLPRGFSYGLLDTLNKHFQVTLGINRARSSGLVRVYFCFVDQQLLIMLHSKPHTSARILLHLSAMRIGSCGIMVFQTGTWDRS